MTRCSFVPVFALSWTLAACSTTATANRDDSATYGTGYSISKEKLDRIWSHGDVAAYDDQMTAFQDASKQEEFLFYSLLMSNKHGYGQASFDVFFILTFPYGPKPDAIDADTANLAVRYLLKARDERHQQAIETIGDLPLVYDEETNGARLRDLLRAEYE